VPSKLITKLRTLGHETAYREQVRDLAVWCQDRNLSLIISKRKQLIVDYRIWRVEQGPIHIDEDVVEQG
jgi:hypothetical protein